VLAVAFIAVIAACLTPWLHGAEPDACERSFPPTWCRFQVRARRLSNASRPSRSAVVIAQCWLGRRPIPTGTNGCSTGDLLRGRPIAQQVSGLVAGGDLLQTTHIPARLPLKIFRAASVY
jgi:hypothetical protein